MREKSCMIVVPENEEDIRIEKVLARLENIKYIKMNGELKKKKKEDDEDIQGVSMTLSIDGREYKMASSKDFLTRSHDQLRIINLLVP